MLDRRHLLTAAVAAACLLVASGASADTINTFTAGATPSHIKPSTSSAYTFVLTNDAASPEGADRAKIGIPPGFVVDLPTVQATTSAAGACQASTWVPDGVLLADAKLNLKRPEISPSDELCAGATLTVVFTATSGGEGTAVWASELLRGAAPFALAGSQPILQVDGTAPQVSITSAPSALSNDTSPSFGFSAGEPAQFQCKLDAAAFANCVSPHTYDGLAAGQHTFSVKATDSAGNPSPTAAYTWTIDTTAPTTDLRAKPNDPSNETSPRFTFVGEADSQFTCKLDDAPFEPCASPKTYAAVAPGGHTFSVRATDPAGNTGAAKTYSWTIDTTAPTTSITQKPANPSNESSPSFAFSANEAGSQFACRLDTGSFAPCVSAKSYSGLAAGAHTFSVRATDPAGNTGLADIYTWLVDTVAPTPSIELKPGNPTNDSSPTFTFAAGEPAQFHCRLDGAELESCGSPLTYPALPDGSHTFVVKATDLAGNSGSEAEYTWIVDTVAPTAAIASQPSNPSNDTSPAFSFTAVESGSTFQCKLDGEAFATCGSPKQHTGLSQGAHTFAVKATDKAGNTGPEAAYGWTIDTSAPTAEITQGPGGLSNVSSPSFSFTASQAGSSFLCKRDNEVFASCVSPKSYPGLADGRHTFVLKAIDPAGNASAETSYAWTIDTAAPTTLLTVKPNDPSNDATPSFSFRAGESGSSFACKLDAGAFASCDSPKSLGTLSQGVHTFSVRATDPAGNTGVQASHTWTIDTTAPTTTITQKPIALSANRAPTFSFTASETSSFLCRLDSEQFAACSTPKTYSALGDGSHTFTVRATDQAGNAGVSSSHIWTIDATEPALTISQKPGDPSNDSSPSFSFTATESGSSFTCKLDTAVPAACSAPTTYSNVAPGLHTFTLTATDTAGNTGVASYTWRIDTAAPTATITQRPGNPSNGTSPTFAFSSNEEGVVFACRLEQGGFEACQAPKTYPGLIDGQHAFAVRATDLAGNTGVAATYTWTIDTVKPTTTITAKPGNPSNNPSPSFSFTASEDASFVCRLDGSEAACASPAGYGNLGDGPHTFGVRATDAAGNVGSETTHSWTIETRAPTAALMSGPAGLTNTSAASFAFSADEPSSFDCSVDGRGFEPCSSPATYHGLADGGHAFIVRAWDAVGNVSAQVAHTWTIDTTAPETTVVSAPKSGTASSATFAFSASEGGTFECRLDDAAFALCSSPKSYAGLSKSTHRFEVRAIDAAGNADVTPSVHAWTVQAPVARAARSALLTPRAGARVARPPLLVWRRANRARYYNVQVYRGRRKVLTVWPTKTRFQLQARWKNLGRNERLLPGSYRWYVWPGYGAPSARRYGQLLGQSTFVVARRSGR